MLSNVDNVPSTNRYRGNDMGSIIFDKAEKESIISGTQKSDSQPSPHSISHSLLKSFDFELPKRGKA